MDSIDDSQPLVCSQPMSIDSMVSIPKTNTIPNKPYRYEDTTNGLRSIEEISPVYRHIFQYPYFNKMQSQIMDDVLYSDKSLVVSAPTGSGKTVIFELAIVRLLMQLNDSNYKDDFKIIYMAPTKALCTERLMDWYGKFIKLGLTSIEVTGDSDTLNFSQLKSHRIIMTTPEKWDSLTRRWKDNKQMVEMVKLFIMDEVHLLNEDVRGPVLEVVVSRMKTIQEVNHATKCYKNVKNAFTDIRFIAASATIPNAEDIAEWLKTKYKPSVCFNLGDEYRSVKLVKIVEGYPCRDGQSLFKFDLFLNYRVKAVMEKYCGGKPTLIFCNTRKSVMLTAETLSKELLFHFTNGQTEMFIEMASKLSEKKLQKLALSGIGCHHAGFLQNDRNIIEQMFRLGNLPVLITTSTLAMGVNLPAHLVIIKTTQHYVNGAYTEYEESMILQMMGRAGRPQFDNEGVAVIMTKNQDRGRYEQLCGGQRAVESKLHRHLAEHLNAEVALGTIGDLLLAMDWLRSTFLYVRATRNPSHYGCNKLADRESIEKRLQEICVKWMNALARVGLLVMDGDTRVTSTEPGVLMATYCLDLDTMKLILKIKGNESLSDLLNLISECHEFEDIALRANEKRCLNQLNKNSRAPSCRFPLPGKIHTKHMKANCLIQAVFGSLPILDPSLNQESVKILRLGENIIKCIVAYITRPSYVQTEKKIFKVVLNSTILAKCFSAKMWDNSEYVNRQLNGIGPAFALALATAGKTSFETIRQSNPRDLERLINRGPPAGNVLKKQVELLPIYGINLELVSERLICVSVCIKNAEGLIAKDVTTTGNKHKVILIIGNSENELLYFDTIMDVNLLSLPSAKISRKFHMKSSSSHNTTIFANLISHSWVGLDVHTELSVKKSNCDIIFSNSDTIQSSQETNIDKKVKNKLPKLNSNKSKQDQCKLKQTTIKRNRNLIDSLYAQETNSNPKVLKTTEMSNVFNNDPIDFDSIDNQLNEACNWMDYDSWKNMLKLNSSSVNNINPKHSQSNSAKFANEIEESFITPRERNIDKTNDECVVTVNDLPDFKWGCDEDVDVSDRSKSYKKIDDEIDKYIDMLTPSDDLTNHKINNQCNEDTVVDQTIECENFHDDNVHNQHDVILLDNISINSEQNNLAANVNDFVDNYMSINGEQNQSTTNNDSSKLYDDIIDESILSSYIEDNTSIGVEQNKTTNMQDTKDTIYDIKLYVRNQSTMQLDEIDFDINHINEKQDSILNDESYWTDEINPFDTIKMNQEVRTEDDQNMQVQLYRSDASLVTVKPSKVNQEITPIQLNLHTSNDESLNFIKTMINSKYNETINLELNYLKRSNSWILSEMKKPIFPSDTNANKKLKSVSWGNPLVLSSTNQFDDKIVLNNMKEVSYSSEDVVFIPNDDTGNVGITKNDELAFTESINDINCTQQQLEKDNSQKNKVETIKSDKQVFENLRYAYKNHTKEEVLEKYKNLINWLNTSPFEDSEYVENFPLQYIPIGPGETQLSSEIIHSILNKYEFRQKEVSKINANETGSMGENFDSNWSMETMTDPVQEKINKNYPTNQTQPKNNLSISNVFSNDDEIFLNMYRDRPDYSKPTYKNSPIETIYLENINASDDDSFDKYYSQLLKPNDSLQYDETSSSSFKVSPKCNDVGNYLQNRLASSPVNISQRSCNVPNRSQEMFFKNKFVCENTSVTPKSVEKYNVSNAYSQEPVLNHFMGRIDIRSMSMTVKESIKLKIDALKEFENTPKPKLGNSRGFFNF